MSDVPIIKTWYDLEVGDRIKSVLGNGTVKAVHTTYQGQRRTAVWVWYDSERVRYIMGRDHAGYVRLEQNTEWKMPGTSHNVIVAHCPNCDEPDMIFYEGDYICAWCREHLEEACL